jgi:hypothetical protein
LNVSTAISSGTVRTHGVLGQRRCGIECLRALVVVP